MGQSSSPLFPTKILSQYDLLNSLKNISSKRYINVWSNSKILRIMFSVVLWKYNKNDVYCRFIEKIKQNDIYTNENNLSVTVNNIEHIVCINCFQKYSTV